MKPPRERRSKQRRTEKLRSAWRKHIRPLLIVLVAACSFRSAVADWNDVPSGSMRPNIVEGDRIFVNKLSYDLKVPFTTWRIARWASPRRGDVVVLYGPEDGKRLVKRVIGLPGDTVELRDNRLVINGQPASYEPLGQTPPDETSPKPRLLLEELAGHAHPVVLTPAVNSPKRCFGPMRVPPGRYFLLGDNRDYSRDSRWFGFVPQDNIVGRAGRIILSVDPDHRYRPRWNRFFKPLP